MLSLLSVERLALTKTFADEGKVPPGRHHNGSTTAWGRDDPLPPAWHKVLDSKGDHPVLLLPHHTRLYHELQGGEGSVRVHSTVH